MIEKLKNIKKLYLDTNIIVYFVERHDQFILKIQNFFQFTHENNIQIIISDLVIAECFYGTYKLESVELLSKYQFLFYDLAYFDKVNFASETIINAAKLGSENRLKLIDALHMQIAIDNKCEMFFTNDTAFKSNKDITILQLSDI